MDWTRPEFDVSIISETPDQKKFLQAKMLAKRFFQDVYRHLKDVESRNFSDDYKISETDCPYYFQSLKSAYEAACTIQNPQRLPDFDVLFQGPKEPPLPFKIEETPNGVLRVVVAG